MTTPNDDNRYRSPRPRSVEEAAELCRLPSTSPGATGFRGFAARHPIAAFLIMTFSIAYPVMAIPVLAMHGVIPGRHFLEALPRDPEEMSSLILTWCALLPSAVYVTWAAEGQEGVGRLFRRVFRWRFGLRWWVFILTAMPILAIGLGIVLGDSVRPLDPLDLLPTQLGQLLINLLLVNLWEETAWGGFLQTRLEQRHNALIAGLLAAVPFGFAHWPLAFLGEFTAASVLISLVAYVVLGALVRPLAGLVMRGARDSVLALALVHSVFNRTNNPDGIPATLLEGEGNSYALLLVMVLLTVALAVRMRRRLSMSYRLGLDRDAQASTTHSAASLGRPWRTRSTKPSH